MLDSIAPSTAAATVATAIVIVWSTTAAIVVATSIAGVAYSVVVAGVGVGSVDNDDVAGADRGECEGRLEELHD